MTARIAATWVTVFTFPSGLAGITTPCCPAATRRPLTANSRAMITIATHAATRCRLTSVISAAAISSLSAIGSITFPNVVMSLRERAMYPSSPSVSAASANTAAASADAFGVADRSATTSTGTSRILSRVRRFGTFRGNTRSPYPGRTAPNQHLEAERAAERTERRDGRGEQRPGEDALDGTAVDEQAQDDPAEAVDPAERLLRRLAQVPDPHDEQRAEHARLERRIEAHGAEVAHAFQRSAQPKNC